MRKTLAAMAILLTVGLTVALDAEAKRLGGGKSSGMQRQATSAPAQNQPPAGAASKAPVAGAASTAAAPAAAAAAATSKRSWMAPLAGLAAGLGIAALASHLGFGEALAGILTAVLLVVAVLAVVGFLLRKRLGASGALVGAGGTGQLGGTSGHPGAPAVTSRVPLASGTRIGSRLGTALGGAAATGATAGSIPADFDVRAFERIARDQFVALQAANDARDLHKLRDYLSAEMFEVVRSEIAGRGDAPQATEVFGLQAQVVGVAQAGQYVVSVRFTGSIREQPGALPEDLDEVWHLAKPIAGSGGWVIAGIQQA